MTYIQKYRLLWHRLFRDFVTPQGYNATFNLFVKFFMNIRYCFYCEVLLESSWFLKSEWYDFFMGVFKFYFDSTNKSDFRSPKGSDKKSGQWPVCRGWFEVRTQLFLERVKSVFDIGKKSFGDNSSSIIALSKSILFSPLLLCIQQRLLRIFVIFWWYLVFDT